VVVESGHYIQQDRPQAVVDTAPDSAMAAGLDVTECRVKETPMRRLEARAGLQ
jgi:hypothetical protein